MCDMMCFTMFEVSILIHAICITASKRGICPRTAKPQAGPGHVCSMQEFAGIVLAAADAVFVQEIDPKNWHVRTNADCLCVMFKGVGFRHRWHV